MRNRSAILVRSLILSAGFALVFAFLATPARAQDAFDGGGRVGDYLDFVAQADASGSLVEIAGLCASACTMKLGARGACIHPDAELLFHAARNPDGQINALATRIQMMEYPPRIRAWVASAGALDSTAFTTMSGAQAITLGVRACKARFHEFSRLRGEAEPAKSGAVRLRMRSTGAG